MIDESTESVIRLHGLEIREHEKRLNMLAMDLENLDYEEIMNYRDYLIGMAKKQYKCIEKLYLPTCDGDGFQTGKTMIIKTETIWNMAEDKYRFIGGEIRLENDKLGWIEISKESFEQCFEAVKLK